MSYVEKCKKMIVEKQTYKETPVMESYVIDVNEDTVILLFECMVSKGWTKDSICGNMKIYANRP